MLSFETMIREFQNDFLEKFDFEFQEYQNQLHF